MNHQQQEKGQRSQGSKAPLGAGGQSGRSDSRAGRPAYQKDREARRELTESNPHNLLDPEQTTEEKKPIEREDASLINPEHVRGGEGA